MLSVSTQLTAGDDLAAFAKMLDSVTFADEIVIFNMDRDDEAASQLFAKYGARVIKVKTPPVVEYIRAQQIRATQNDWVLIMDYDEIIPPSLAREIRTITHAKESPFSAYFLTRHNFSLGFPLKHGGFEADAVPRLFRKSMFRSWPTDIHSMPLIKGELGTCRNPMEHHKDASLSQMLQKTNRYTEVEARQFLEGGTAPVTSLILLRKTLMEFLRRYLLKFGFLDGPIGLIQALYQSYAIFLRYAKLYELQTTKGHK